MMETKRLERLLQQGEGYNLEYKEGYIKNIALEVCVLAKTTVEHVALESFQPVSVKVFTWAVNEVRDLKIACDMNVSSIRVHLYKRVKF